MAGEDLIMGRQGELERLHIIQKVLEGIVKQVGAMEILSLSGRQIRRIVKRIRSEGSSGIIHRSRGRPLNRRISHKIKERVIHLTGRSTKIFGPTLASEKLLERNGIGINDETLRRWLIEAGYWKKIRKARGIVNGGNGSIMMGRWCVGWVPSRLVGREGAVVCLDGLH